MSMEKLRESSLQVVRLCFTSYPLVPDREMENLFVELFHNSVNYRDYVRVFLLRLNSSRIRDLDSLRLISSIPLVQRYRRIIYRNAFYDRCSVVSLVALFPRFSSTHSLLAIRNKTASRPTLAFSLQRFMRLKPTPSRNKKVLGRLSQFRLPIRPTIGALYALTLSRRLTI